MQYMKVDLLNMRYTEEYFDIEQEVGFEMAGKHMDMVFEEFVVEFEEILLMVVAAVVA